MNKVFNIWILIITVLTYPVAIAVGKNLDFSLFGLSIQGEEFPHKELYFSICAGLIFLFGAIRSSKKWLGLRVVKQIDRFQFSSPISEKRKRRVRLYNFLEIAFYFLFAGGLIYFSEYAMYVALVFVILAVDNIINTVLGLSKKQYRIGMTKKAIVIADRETKAVYFKGLKKISHHQQTMYFEYVNGLVLHFQDDFIPKEEWNSFVQTLKANVSPEKVYYSNL